MFKKRPNLNDFIIYQTHIVNREYYRRLWSYVGLPDLYRTVAVYKGTGNSQFFEVGKEIEVRGLVALDHILPIV